MTVTVVCNKGHTRPWSDSLLMGSSFIKLMFTILISMNLFALATFHKNLRRLEHLYVVSSFLIPLVINLTACRHGNSAYLKEETVFITLFAVLMLVSLLMVWEPYSVIEHVEGGMPFFLNITNNTGRHFVRWYFFSCTQYSLICLQCHYLALNCLRYCNTRI